MTCPLCGGPAAAWRALAWGEVARCAGCGAGFRTERPGPDRLAALYGEPYFRAWEGGDPGRGPLVRALKAATFAAVLRRLPPPRPGDRLLDVGCATGAMLEAGLARGFAACGVEVSPWAAARAAAVPGAVVHRGTLADAPFPAGGFAVVTLCDVLEHMADPAADLRRVASLLRPGGVAAVVTPDFGSWSRRLLGSRWPHLKPEHLWLFTRGSLDRLAAAAGLRPAGGGRAWKRVSAASVAAHFAAYPVPGFSPLVRGLARVLPPSLRDRPFPASFGERLAVYSAG